MIPTQHFFEVVQDCIKTQRPNLKEELKWCHNCQQNDTKHNDTQQIHRPKNNIQQRDSQQNHTEQNHIQQSDI